MAIPNIVDGRVRQQLLRGLHVILVQNAPVEEVRVEQHHALHVVAKALGRIADSIEAPATNLRDLAVQKLTTPNWIQATAKHAARQEPQVFHFATPLHQLQERQKVRLACQLVSIGRFTSQALEPSTSGEHDERHSTENQQRTGDELLQALRDAVLTEDRLQQVERPIRTSTGARQGAD